MKRLLAVGDSFTRGDELEDLDLAWPKVLGNKIGYHVTNLAQSGGANQRIVREIVTNVNNYDLFVIGWSMFDRLELCDDAGIFESWPAKRCAHMSRSMNRRDFDKWYTLNFNDDYLYREYLIDIIATQSILELHNKPYIMIDAFGNHLWPQRFTDANKDLISRIHTDHFVGWPDASMQEIAGDCEYGPIGHFLQVGHERVADKIYEYIRNFGWVS